MLSQKALKALSLSRSKITQTPFRSISTSCISPNSNYDGSRIKLVGEEEEKPNRELTKWRESFKATEPYIPLDADNLFFRIWRSKVELTPWGIKKFLKKSFLDKQVALQSFIPQRHQILGADLALAHFLIFIGGKVKFKDRDQWVSMEVDRASVDLPDRFDPNYIVTEIDASDCVLYYEGLQNFQGCPRVKRAIFARSPEIDDWCVDKIAGLFPFIEYLDLSDCPKVSERGLEALYKTGMLQTLIVTNHYKSAAFELTCMMLEDVVPGLQVEIREPKETIKPQINSLE